jgi:hypothetical protein
MRGFECEAGEFTDLLMFLGAALVRIASWAVEAFEVNVWGSETRCSALTCTPRVLVGRG